jgi:hypothetical protein
MLLSFLVLLFLWLVLVQGEEALEAQIVITNASFEAPSPERDNLNGEWVEITNMGASAQSMEGWTLEDQQNHSYKFTNFALEARASVKVHTGKAIY